MYERFVVYEAFKEICNTDGAEIGWHKSPEKAIEVATKLHKKNGRHTWVLEMYSTTPWPNHDIFECSDIWSSTCTECTY